MVCPRCSLHNPKGTVVCGRCGEVAPRAAELSIDTRPPVEGPRASPTLQRDVGLDRRGRGLRAVGGAPPVGGVRMRAAARLRARTDEIERRVALSRAGDAPRGPAPTTEGTAALDSTIHHARTEPHWHRQPVDEPLDEPVTNPGPAAPYVAAAVRSPPMRAANSDPEAQLRPFSSPQDSATSSAASQPSSARTIDPPAPVGLRAAAAALDLLVVLLVVVVAWVGAGVAFGGAVVGPHLARGFDAVVDGLFVARGLGWLTLGFAGVVTFAYLTLSHALVGASFGKQLLGLRVETRTGHRPSLGAAATRTVLAFLFTLPAGLSWFTALFDGRVRTIHDRLVGTRVVLLGGEELVSTIGPATGHGHD